VRPVPTIKEPTSRGLFFLRLSSQVFTRRLVDSGICGGTAGLLTHMHVPEAFGYERHGFADIFGIPQDGVFLFRQSVLRAACNLPDAATKGQQRIAEKNLDRLYRTIWKDEVVSYYTEKDQSYDRVLDIFTQMTAGRNSASPTCSFR
jgi:hypothetical protein